MRLTASGQEGEHKILPLAPVGNDAAARTATACNALLTHHIVVLSSDSSWGHQFRSSFLKLSFIKSAYPSLPLMLLTATATRQVQSDVLKALHLDPASVEFIRQSFNRPNIYYSVCHKETIKTIEGEDMTIYKHMKQFIDKCAALLPNNNTANATNDSAATVPKPLAPIFTAAARSSAPPRQAGGARPSTPSTPRSATPSAPICTGIIYCGSRDACDLVASELRKLKSQ